jgi:hypothetical protein
MILEKEEIKFIFNPYVLQPGDILLMNTYEETFRKRMGCKYEHAAIYIGDAFLMEANGAHVVMSHIYSYAFREQEHACVLRLKKCSPIVMQYIALSARKQMGREYVNTMMFRDVRKFKETDIKDKSNRSYCSRLVAQSYASEGVDLLPNADYCEPDDFLNVDKLEEVKNAIVPFTEDLAEVIMNNQRQRDESDTDSPNAELFHSLGQLYGEDIQDLGQALKPSFTRPGLNDQAIAIIKASRMFKHMEDVKRDMPWFFDDEKFLRHYGLDVERALHMVYSQMNHYDNTIIPSYRQLHLQMLAITFYNPDNTLLLFMRDYIAAMVEDAIKCRKRLTELFYLLDRERSTNTSNFVQKYGLYSDIDYEPKTIDIGFILNDLLKASFNLHKR